MRIVVRVCWSMAWRQAIGLAAAAIVFGLLGMIGGISFEASAGVGGMLVSLPLALWAIREALAVNWLGTTTIRIKQQGNTTC